LQSLGDVITVDPTLPLPALRRALLAAVRAQINHFLTIQHLPFVPANTRIVIFGAPFAERDD
jgi:hypothetical protein